MAKIVKIDLNLSQKIVNPFRTSRNSHTNPFAFEDFEGNTIDPMLCADVLEKTGTIKTNKMKMVVSSVVGSMTKIRTGITEPIVKFVNKVKEGWQYAKETDILDATGLRKVGNHITTFGNGIKDSVSNLGKHFTGNITDFGKGISDKWNSVIENLKPAKRVSSTMPVAEIREMWIAENNKLAELKEAS